MAPFNTNENHYAMKKPLINVRELNNITPDILFEENIVDENNNKNIINEKYILFFVFISLILSFIINKLLYFIIIYLLFQIKKLYFLYIPFFIII